MMVVGETAFDARSSRDRVGVGLFALCVLNGIGWGQSVDVKERAVVAAKTREDRARTVFVKYKQETRFAKGAMSELSAVLSRSKENTGPVPAVDTAVDFINSLTIDSLNCRFENNEPVWNLEEGKLYDNKYVSAFNGRSARKLFPSGIRGQATPQGYVLDKRESMGGRTFELLPIMWAFRGLQSGFTATTLDRAKFTGRQERIDGTPCAEFMFAVSNKSMLTIWLDAEKDYLLHRLYDISNGKIIRSLNVSRFEQHAGLWAPTGWTFEEFNDSGNIKRSVRIQVDQIALNEKVPPMQFEIDFPCGCRVFDQRSGKHYDVDADGSLRETNPSEPIGVRNPGALWQAITIALMSLALLACLTWTYSRRQGRRQTECPDD